MTKVKKIPEAELEIMLIAWEAEEAVTSGYIMERLHKDWTKPTLLKLLTRLCEREFLRCDKEGRHNLYTVLVPREDYVQEASGTLLQKLHRATLKARMKRYTKQAHFPPFAAGYVRRKPSVRASVSVA